MRLFYLLLALFFVLGLILMMLNIVVSNLSVAYNQTKYYSQKAVYEEGVNMNLTNYDFIEKIKPYIAVLDISYAITLILVIIAIFIYSRRRL